MSGPSFFQTKMGHIFFEGTMPRLYRAIGRLADTLGGAPREYKVLDEGKWEEEDLNALGKEGWRVVHISDFRVVLERVMPREER